MKGKERRERNRPCVSPLVSSKIVSVNPSSPCNSFIDVLNPCLPLAIRPLGRFSALFSYRPLGLVDAAFPSLRAAFFALPPAARILRLNSPLLFLRKGPATEQSAKAIFPQLLIPSIDNAEVAMTQDEDSKWWKQREFRANPPYAA